MVYSLTMSNRSYPSRAPIKKLKKIRETGSLKNFPKLTSLGFKSKPKDIEGNGGDGIKEDACDLSVMAVRLEWFASDIERRRSVSREDT